MPEAYVEYTGDGSVNDFTVTFGYLKKSHVKVYLDGVEDQTFTWIDATSIAATTTPASGVTVLISRSTPRDALVYEIPDSGTYKGADLNNQALQALYIAAEGYDALENTIALDTADNTWDADTKRIKNIVDPVNAQDVLTKNYSLSGLESQLASISTSAATASSAASTATTAASDADADRIAAAASAAAASTDAGTASTDATTATNEASYAEEWANKAEDSLVSAAAGGDLSDDYSALHFANKAAASAAAANADATAAAAAVDGINPPDAPRNADELLQGEEGIALHFLARDYRVRDYANLTPLDDGPTLIEHNAPFTMTTNTSLTVHNRAGGVEALSANEVPWDHDVSGNPVEPLGMECAGGNHYMTEATIASTFPIDQDNFTIYCEFECSNNTGTQDIVDLYSTGVTTDAFTLMNDAGTIKVDVWSATVNTHTHTIGSAPTPGTVCRAAFTVRRNDSIRSICTGLSAVQGSGVITVPSADATDLRLGFSLNGWLRKWAYFNRSFMDDELKLLCGISS